MIQIFTLNLAANEAREVAVQGEYFELRNAVYPIALVELLDRSGGVISRLENPEQSDYVKPGRYETIRITNGPTAQTVRHFYGSGDAGSRRTSGLVQVDGTVSVVGAVDVIDVIGAGAEHYFRDTTGVSAFGSAQVLAPASNVSGATVRGFYLSATCGASAVATGAFVASGTAPTAMTTGSDRYFVGYVRGNGSSQSFSNQSMFRRIPAGWGIWHCWQGGGDSTGQVHGTIEFDLVP